MAAGGGLSDSEPVFKSDFASLVHSSYREELVREYLTFFLEKVQQPNILTFRMMRNRTRTVK